MSSFHRKTTLHLYRCYSDMFTNIILYKQLRVMGGKKQLARKFRKYVNMANSSEIGHYQIYFALKLIKRNHLTFEKQI